MQRLHRRTEADDQPARVADHPSGQTDQAEPQRLHPLAHPLLASTSRCIPAFRLCARMLSAHHAALALNNWNGIWPPAGSLLRTGWVLHFCRSTRNFSCPAATLPSRNSEYSILTLSRPPAIQRLVGLAALWQGKASRLSVSTSVASMSGVAGCCRCMNHSGVWLVRHSDCNCSVTAGMKARPATAGGVAGS